MASNKQKVNVEHHACEGAIHTLKGCCEALRNELHALKECLQEFRTEIQTLRNENHQLKERVRQLETPLHGTIKLSDIGIDTKWTQNGVIVAGGQGCGSGLNQLWAPEGLCVDDNHQSIYIADGDNHRIVQWSYGASSGRVVAGGHGKGNRNDQLHFPRNVIVDTETDSLIICDWGNRRVVRWPRRGGTHGETLISDIECFGGLAMDENRNLYVSDFQKNEVKRWKLGESHGTVVAGGNGDGNGLNQLNSPTYIFVDREHSVYVSDKDNQRVMMWKEGAQEGVIVAGGHGKGSDLTKLKYPYGIVVDQLGTIYVADSWNNRVMRWPKGAAQGDILVGGNGEGEEPNQLEYPVALLFDRQGHLYVTDHNNHRILKFNNTSSSSSS